MDEIRELIRMIDESKIEEFEVDMEGARLSIKKTIHKLNYTGSASLPEIDRNIEQTAHIEMKAEPTVEYAERNIESSAEQNDSQVHKIVSPMVGTFYAAPSPDAAPYVKIGDQLQTNSVVCVVEAMKLMNEIEAEVSGQIIDVLVENGQIVEYGQPLFLVKI